MKVFVLLALVGISAAIDYEHVLQSPGELKALFSEFNSKFNKHFTAAEGPMRLRLFRGDIKRIVELNKEHEGEWTSGINEFTAMTTQEKQQHLGLNGTLSGSNEPRITAPAPAAPAASDLDWRAQGKVTGIKNQGGCGSCWAFAAVGALETNYAIRTGRRKQFAEQEYLDCTYSSSRDGCKGGWYYQAWDYSRTSGRLATMAAAPYTERDGACSYSWKHNGLQAAVITGTNYISKGESNMINALNNGAVSVAYEVTDDFFKYTTGIIRDNTCSSWANHAVTAVGYTRGAMIVRNSWGQWGMKGYFYTARGHHGCQIYDHGAAPTWRSTGRTDTDPDYVPTDDDECNGTNADGCPCGTVRCGDGQCRHAHMCH